MLSWLDTTVSTQVRAHEALLLTCSTVWKIPSIMLEQGSKRHHYCNVFLCFRSINCQFLELLAGLKVKIYSRGAKQALFMWGDRLEMAEPSPGRCLLHSVFTLLVPQAVSSSRTVSDHREQHPGGFCICPQGYYSHKAAPGHGWVRLYDTWVTLSQCSAATWCWLVNAVPA